LSGSLRRLRPAAALVALVMGAAACPAGTPTPAAAPCAPVDGVLAAGTRADVLAGRFRLVMTATGGLQSGQSAMGTLRLEAFGGQPLPVPAAAGVRYPLFGGADVDVARVGAFAVGDVRRADPSAPGVLVMEYARANAPAGTNDILLRLGADSNSRGQQRFDGAFLALAVRSVSADGFAGTWESGAGQPQSAGYFCAQRIS
jgi:hypothetical protein